MFRFKSDVAPLPAVSADDKIIRLGLLDLVFAVNNSCRTGLCHS
jgi:hypothetical protein